jgi:trehalose 6-phosphate synthase
MEAIDHYFASHPERIGKITFVQVCQPTRIGLPAFDDYWQKVRARSAAVNARWQSGAWQPVSWIDKPVPPKVLAWLYSKAEAMLINPVRDGLNLTAKEFAVCSTNGALILSRGAGVWHEIGDKVLPVKSLKAEEIAGQIEAALTMPMEDKMLSLREMKKTIAANTLKSWWRNFEMGSTANTKVVPISSRAKKNGTKLLMAK